jgi:protocatechuate 3,4-dioxygenase beta subunit
MKHFRTSSAPRAQVAALAAALLLSACGGGGGSPGTVPGSSTGSTGGTGGTGGTGTGTGGTTVTASPTVTLAFANAGGTASNALTGATPLTVKATVLDKDNKPVPNAIVTFATDNTLAAFSPSAGTALTDASGVASVTMRAASLAAGGAGTVTATSTVAGSTITGTSNYSVGATSLTFGTLSASPSSLQAYGSTVLSVDVLAGGARYTAQQVNVSFSSNCVTAGKATLASTVATNNGTAQTVYRDQGCGTSDQITVSATGVAQPATTTLTIAPPAAASVQFVAAVPTSQSIVIKGNGGNGRTETATLTFKVVDKFGNPLAGQRVDFTRVPANADVTINKPGDTTDASGNVITTVNSGSTATSFRVQATLPGSGTPAISTMSDSVVVTTGLPVQQAFSISTGTFNINGWNIDSSPTTPATSVQVMVADAFGNPVPDGTPIVFQTNMGSVGSSSKGGCSTVNGGCAVDFRAQAPRIATAPNIPATPCNTGPGSTPDSTRVGLATVCASTTDGTNTVFAKTAIFFSGSDALNVTWNGVKVSYDVNNPNDLGSINFDDTRTFQLQLNDVNNNPMPSGTSVAVTGMLNGSAGPVSPSSVPSIAPHSSSGDDKTGNSVSTTAAQGSFHTITVTAAKPNPCATKTATFYVTTTTPTGSVTNIPFKLTFTCS